MRRKPYKVENIKAWKSDARTRKKIIAEKIRPFILSDGDKKYWDGITGYFQKDTPLRRFSGQSVMMAEKFKKELQIMTKEGCFPEALGSWIDSERWWQLMDIWSGYRSQRASRAIMVFTGEVRTVEENKKKWKNGF